MKKHQINPLSSIKEVAYTPHKYQGYKGQELFQIERVTLF